MRGSCASVIGDWKFDQPTCQSAPEEHIEAHIAPGAALSLWECTCGRSPCCQYMDECVLVGGC